MYLPRFQAAGRALADSGLISGASGNLSIRLNDRLIITRHDSVLSALTASDLIETGIHTDDRATSLASWELPVHRAIYMGTAARAIVHAHPPSAVTLSLAEKTPAMPGKIEIIGKSTGIVAGVLAEEISQALKKCPLVTVRGHGTFAVGITLEEACRLTIKFEAECAELCRKLSLRVKESRE